MSINDRAVRRTGRSGKRAGKKGADDPAVAEQHFQLALRSAPVVLFTHDADLRYTWVSGPGTGPELLGKTDLELSDLHAAESAERIVEFKLEVLKGGKGARRDVGVIIAGQQRVIDLSVEPIRDAEWQIIGISGAAIDVTEQRESKEATASRQKDEFLAVLAHELRNPLAPIRGAVQLLRLLGSSVPDKGLAIEVIDRQVDTLARLVDDLLDVSRFTRGKVALRKELLEVSSTIQRAIETTLPLIHARGQTLSVSLSNEPLYVEGDSTRLEQVFCNLLNNAAKFMPQGGRIEVSCRRTEGQAAVHIRDHGRGLAAETIPLLFEPFYQVDQGLARSEGGLGLGLALAKQLVELHGGRIEAQSAGVGAGSEFVVRLPLAKPTSSSRSRLEAQSSSAAAKGGLRILIVDDSPDAVTTMKLLLEVRGHEPRTASDGPEALAIFAEFRPQVILLDIGLPGMDGYEIAKRVRKTESGEHVKIIATTGYGRDEDRLRATEAGFDFHLTKPVNFKTLEELLQGIRG